MISRPQQPDCFLQSKPPCTVAYSLSSCNRYPYIFSSEAAKNAKMIPGFEKAPGSSGIRKNLRNHHGSLLKSLYEYCFLRLKNPPWASQYG